MTRFNNYDTDPTLSNLYVKNGELDKIGKPDEITVVILPGKVTVKSVTVA